MEKEVLEDFDKFAYDYKTILDKSLKIGGEKSDYFTVYKAELVKRYAGRDFNGRILDFGCGIGLLSAALLKCIPGAIVDGVDVSAASIEHVPGYLKQRGAFKSNIKDLPQKYDLIVAANVLHHIEPDIRQEVILNLSSYLKKDGKIFIFEHNPLNPVTRRIVKHSPLDKGVVLLPCDETARYLKKSGFFEPRLNYIVFFPKFLSFLRWSEPYLYWFPIGAQYVLIGHK